MTRGPVLSQFIFTNQFKCANRVKLKVFVLKVATSGPHLTFLSTYKQCNNQGRIYHTADCQELHGQMVRLFFVFTYITPEDVAKNCQGLAQCRSGSGNNMVCESNRHSTVPFSITIHLHLASFYATKYF